MRLFGGMRHAPQQQNFTYNDIKGLGYGGSVTVRIAASIAAVLLVIASAGFGCVYAYMQGSHQGAALALLAVCMALGLECAKPFAVDAVFTSFRSLAVGRALAMLVLAAVAVGYSLTAELSLMAMTRGDMAASRAQVTDAAKDDRAELARIVAERAGMRFIPATAELVSAARDAVAAAERTRAAECNKRGPNCRQREADEATARAMLGKAIADKAATDRALALDATAADIRARLAQAPATAAADPGAAALAGYLGVFGVKVDVGLLAQWLVLVGVLALEVGSALSVLLVHAAAGRQIRPVAAVQELPSPDMPKPDKAAVALSAAPPSPCIKKGRGRPARERKAAETVILGQLKANGGKLPSVAASARRLGKMAGVSKSTVNSVMLAMMAAGVVAQQAGRLVLVA
jgi:hypothetical protein